MSREGWDDVGTPVRPIYRMMGLEEAYEHISSRDFSTIIETVDAAQREMAERIWAYREAALQEAMASEPLTIDILRRAQRVLESPEQEITYDEDMEGIAIFDTEGQATRGIEERMAELADDNWEDEG